MKTTLQIQLTSIAPSISIDTIWSHDDSATWDIEGDLREEDFQAWQSEICARAIMRGSMIFGHQYLGGTWEAVDNVPWESNPEISGYELQMTEEALAELRGKVLDQPELRDQCTAAELFCIDLMHKRAA